MANVPELSRTVAELTDALEKSKAENRLLKKQVEDFCEEMHKSYKQQRRDLKEHTRTLDIVKVDLENLKNCVA